MILFGRGWITSARLVVVPDILIMKKSILVLRFPGRKPEQAGDGRGMVQRVAILIFPEI